MGILLVYDVTDEASFQHIRDWMKNIEEHASENVNKILLGNKCDLVEKKVVDAQRAKKLAEEYGIELVETSAKNNIGVEESFFKIARAIKARLIDAQEAQGIGQAGDGDAQGSGGFRIPPSGTDGAQPKKKNCC